MRLICGYGPVSGQSSETVPVGHLYLSKVLNAENEGLRNNIIQMQNVGCDGINLICRQRFLISVGHRTTNIVKQGGCVGPVAAYRLVRSVGGEAADSASDGVSG